MMSLEFLRHLKSSQTSQENFSLWNKPVTNTNEHTPEVKHTIVLTILLRCNLVKSKPISTGLNPVYAACDNYFHIWLQLLIPCFSPCETSPRESLGNAGNYQQPPKEKKRGEIPPGQNGTAIREKHEKTLNYSFKYIWSFLGWLQATYRTNCRQYKPLQQLWSC